MTSSHITSKYDTMRTRIGGLVRVYVNIKVFYAIIIVAVVFVWYIQRKQFTEAKIGRDH